MNRTTYELFPVRFGEIYLLFSNREQERLLTKCAWGEFLEEHDDVHMVWQNGSVKPETPGFQEELDALVWFLREGPLKDQAAMAHYCHTHLEGRVGTFAGRVQWGFRISTATQRCYLRCSPDPNHSFFCLLCYLAEEGASRGRKQTL